jgi:hypothetical protein
MTSFNNNNDILNSNGKDFINKKRKGLPKIYQNILEKSILHKQPIESVIINNFIHLFTLDTC